MNRPRTDSIKAERWESPERNLNSDLRRMVDERGLPEVQFELSEIEKEIQRHKNQPHEFKSFYAMGMCEICGKMEDQGRHI